MTAVVVFGVIAAGLWVLTYVARAAFTSKHRNDQTFIIVPVCAVVSSAISLGSLVRVLGLQGIILPILLVLMGALVLGGICVLVLDRKV